MPARVEPLCLGAGAGKSQSCSPSLSCCSLWRPRSIIYCTVTCGYILFSFQQFYFLKKFWPFMRIFLQVIQPIVQKWKFYSKIVQIQDHWSWSRDQIWSQHTFCQGFHKCMRCYYNLFLKIGFMLKHETSKVTAEYTKTGHVCCSPDCHHLLSLRLSSGSHHSNFSFLFPETMSVQ